MSRRALKILAVASAVDLDFRYGCTPAWWQLWKGMHEAGCDLIVTPYRGRAVEAPWVIFYDGDVPMSLPEFGGMDTGFNYYHGADPGEYDLVVSNSEGGLDRLAMAGTAVVSNPYEGIERWFEPGRELLVVSSADEAVEAYCELLDDPARAEELGRAARERALGEHTYVHWARRLLELVGIGRPAATPVAGG
jgi:glycosyltransferase involved in cell wall biosynthesis